MSHIHLSKGALKSPLHSHDRKKPELFKNDPYCWTYRKIGPRPKGYFRWETSITLNPDRILMLVPHSTALGGPPLIGRGLLDILHHTECSLLYRLDLKPPWSNYIDTSL